MSWKDAFDKGVACFERGDTQEAYNHINQAAELYRSNLDINSSCFTIYSSRAAVHEMFGNMEAARRDFQRIIDIMAPDRRQGCALMPRLFSSLVELQQKAVIAEVAVEKQRPSQTSYLLEKLPVETLREIFDVLIDKDHTWAVKLSHVCISWRRILLNAPSAWRTLVLSKKDPLRKVQLWKERAKNRITCMSMTLSRVERTAVYMQLQDLSWADLSRPNTSGEAYSQLKYLLYYNFSLPDALSNLEELILDDLRGHHSLHISSGSNRKLKILRLTGNISVCHWASRRLQQLKELQLEGSLSFFDSRVFSANPFLERLHLHCQILHPHREGPVVPISMDHLKTIELRGMALPLYIIRAVSAPSIASFSMHSTTSADERLFHLASRPSLIELHLSDCSLDPSTLPMLLAATPHLETLQINAISGVVNGMFQFLTPTTVDAQHGLPCRKLQHVDVARCADLTTSSVHAFVKTRVEHAVEATRRCAIVASLRVDNCPHMEPEMLPWFRSKVAQFSCVYETKMD